MKVHSATSFVGVGLLLVFSATLHGCGVTWGKDEAGVREEPAPLEAPPPADGETTAHCHEGEFKCDGSSSSWCAEVAKKCAAPEPAEPVAEAPCQRDGKGCLPECTWSCESQKCHESCNPVCLPPVCSTRCMNFNTNGCKMECSQPSCSVVCPPNYCPRKDCPQCETRCGEPVCKMRCPETPQECRHVCATPSCKWECSAPQNCPKPKCQLTCQKPRDCSVNMQTVSTLPPLAPGETEVLDSTFRGALKPAASFLQLLTPAGEVSTMRVNITSMGKDHSVQSRQVELSLAQEDATTWAKKVSYKSGQMTESEASCPNGRFQCHGDAAWCAGQEKSLCKSTPRSFLQRESSVQGEVRKCRRSSKMLNAVFTQRASRVQGHLQP